MSTDRAEALLRSDQVVLAPGAWDGLSAILVREAGFEAVCAAGFAIAGALGLPDTDVYSKADVLGRVREIRAGVDVPLIADIDHGYGNAAHIVHTIQEFERAGADAVFMEDLRAPKKHPTEGSGSPELTSIEAATAKVRAAVDARERTLIVARTDARDRDEIFRRAHAYASAGADLIFPVAIDPAFGPDAFAALHAELGVPLFSHITVGAWTERMFTPALMTEIGIRIAIAPLHGLFAAAAAMRATLAQLRTATDFSAVSALLMSQPEFLSLIGFDHFGDLEHKYAAEPH